jgi:hypothetical protein
VLTLSRKYNARLARGVIEDFHIRPGNLPAPAGSQRFKNRLLCGKAPRHPLVHELMRQAIALFGRREAAIQKMLAMLAMHPRDACDFNQVDPMAYDGHAEIVCAPRRAASAARYLSRRRRPPGPLERLAERGALIQ